MQTFNQNFALLAEHHYLQTLSNVSMASWESWTRSSADADKPARRV